LVPMTGCLRGRGGERRVRAVCWLRGCDLATGARSGRHMVRHVLGHSQPPTCDISNQNTKSRRSASCTVPCHSGLWNRVNLLCGEGGADQVSSLATADDCGAAPLLFCGGVLCSKRGVVQYNMGGAHVGTFLKCFCGTALIPSASDGSDDQRTVQAMIFQSFASRAARNNAP